MSGRDGISKEDAVQALMSRAAEINLKFVARQPASKELESRGLPCRIAILEVVVAGATGEF